MIIDEIELIAMNQNSFSINHIKNLLYQSVPDGELEGFIVHYLEKGDVRCISLTDNTNNQTSDIAAFAGFQVRSNGRVWQGKNVIVYHKYKGQQLAGKIYKFVKEHYKKSIQSDTEQTIDGQTLWVKTLPSLGLKPMIYDNETGYTIDPTKTNIQMYHTSNSTDQSKFRYTWIIEKSDYYKERNMLQENKIIMPIRYLWHDGGITQNEYNELIKLAMQSNSQESKS